MGRVRVEHHVEALSEVFDAAKVVIRTPFPFASDITDAARPIAISGSRELIERGLHRAHFRLVTDSPSLAGCRGSRRDRSCAGVHGAARC